MWIIRDRKQRKFWIKLVWILAQPKNTFNLQLYNNLTFWYISLLSTALLSCEMSQWHILCRMLTNGRVNSLFLNLNGIPNNLIQEKFTYILTNWASCSKFEEVWKNANSLPWWCYICCHDRGCKLDPLNPNYQFPSFLSEHFWTFPVRVVGEVFEVPIRFISCGHILTCKSFDSSV